MKNWNRGLLFVSALVSGSLLLSTSATAQVNLSTSFEPSEFPFGSTNFTLGTAPDSAQFTGGVTTSIGNLNAYRSGIASWGITAPSGVGTIDFDNPASVVSFYSINLGGGSGTVDVFDNSDTHVGSLAIIGTNMMNNNSLISFTAASFSATGIGKVTLTNDSGAGQQVWVDDFSATVSAPVPEPATLLVVGGGLILTAVRRRKKLA